MLGLLPKILITQIASNLILGLLQRTLIAIPQLASNLTLGLLHTARATQLNELQIVTHLTSKSLLCLLQTILVTQLTSKSMLHLFQLD